jgi:hypothetical protein
MKDAPEVPGDFDMILQNAEGVKNKFIFLIEVEQNNAILDELETLQMLSPMIPPVVTLEQATEALKVAYKLLIALKK